MLATRLISLDEAAGLAREWNALVDAMPFPSFFCTWEWVSTWWEQLGAGSEPVILGFFEGPRLRGVLPLAARRLSLGRECLSGRVLEFCGRGACPDHLDLIASREDAGDCLAALDDFFGERDHLRWDVLLLSHLSAGGSLGTWAGPRRKASGSTCQTVSTAPYLPISGTFGDYAKKCLRERGTTLRRKRRRLAEQGLVYHAGAGIEDKAGLGILFDLHGRRSQAKGLDSAFTANQVFGFHEALVPRIRDRGWGFFRYLGNDERCVAALYGFFFQNRILYYQIGHDPSFDQLSPGAVLMYGVIEEAFERGVAEFDFLRGGESYKSLWTDSQRDLLQVRACNSTPGGVLSSIAYAGRRCLAKTRRNLFPGTSR